MTGSKKRRGPSASRKRRDRTADARARETQATQRRAEAKKTTLAEYRHRRFLGWALVSLGIAVGVQHLLSHWGLFTVISRGWDDLAVGYPMAGLLAIAGTVVLSKA